jgi:hypothetical protein
MRGRFDENIQTMLAAVAVTALSVMTSPSFASDAADSQAEKVVALKDGGNLYVPPAMK